MVSKCAKSVRAVILIGVIEKHQQVFAARDVCVNFFLFAANGPAVRKVDTAAAVGEVVSLPLRIRRPRWRIPGLGRLRS